MLTLEEYNMLQAKKALESGVFNTIFSSAYNKQININEDLIFLNNEDKEKVLRARKNIENLKEIAEGKKIDKIYTLYYYNIYLKNN